MPNNSQSPENSDEAANLEGESLTRERLYELVWSEPMLKVAARYRVSSSYMARVCTRLNVPRPIRGYWAKLAVGKAPKIPALPESRPGDELIWRRGDSSTDIYKPPPRPPTNVPRQRAKEKLGNSIEHALIRGAKSLFEIGRVSRETGYLKPSKKLLVDVIATKAALDKALKFANLLFLSLEARGHRVVIAPGVERFRRESVDERERPSRVRHYSDLWAPGRPTVVYIGTVAIGLTLIEMSEEVKVRYMNGKYIRESEYIPPKLSRFQIDHTWSTTKDLATGRLCLQAYSPYHTAKWQHHWKETDARDLSAQVVTIVKELEKDTIELAHRIEEGERQAAIERERRVAELAKWRKEEDERRAAKALAESRQELIQIINDWAQWKNVERFFIDVEQCLLQMDPEEREVLRARLKSARALLDAGRAIDNLKKWKLPAER